MRTRELGWTGLPVSRLGYGPVTLSLDDRPSRDESIALIQSAYAAGITFFDTADTYCPGPDDLHHNERLLAVALADAPDARIATKGGTVRTPDGWALNSHPERLYQAIVASYEALGGRAPIFLWQHHWPDPRWSIPQMLAPVRRALEERLIQHVGVGNYTLDQLRSACDLLPIASVQNPYNLWNREVEQSGMLEFCEQRRLILIPYHPLGGRELSGRLDEINVVAQLARDHNVSPQCIVLAWHLAQSPCLLPIPGSRRRDHLIENLGAADLVLDARALQQLNSLRLEELPRLNRAPRWTVHPPLSPTTDEIPC